MSLLMSAVESERWVASRGWRLSRRSALGWSIGIAMLVGALVWVAPPAQVIRTIGALNPRWLIAAVGLELGSCVSYLVVFRRFFPEPPGPVSRQVAWPSRALRRAAVLPNSVRVLLQRCRGSTSFRRCRPWSARPRARRWSHSRLAGRDWVRERGDARRPSVRRSRAEICRLPHGLAGTCVGFGGEAALADAGGGRLSVARHGRAVGRVQGDRSSDLRPCVGGRLLHRLSRDDDPDPTRSRGA